MPLAQGFDSSFGHMGGCIDNYSHYYYWSGPNRHDLNRDGREVQEPGRFFGDLMVEEGTRFLRQNKDRPFFLYFAINEPHYPYQGEPKWLKRYAHLKHPRNLYAAFLSTMDERIGRLIAELDALGLRERTIVIVQSDHGHSTEERAFYGGGSAGPYRKAGQGSLFRLKGASASRRSSSVGRDTSRKARSARRSPTAATGCRPSPSCAASRRRRSRSTARAWSR